MGPFQLAAIAGCRIKSKIIFSNSDLAKACSYESGLVGSSPEWDELFQNRQKCQFRLGGDRGIDHMENLSYFMLLCYYSAHSRSFQWSITSSTKLNSGLN